jgi:ADP-ribose pyrophosphatase YjhB (NUDIX family)
MVMAAVPAVGAVIGDGQGRVLLVLRLRPPAVGCWSIPGGRLEPDESLTDAVVREVREETGLQVTVGPLLGRLELPGRDPGTVYDVHDYAATVVGGTLRAGDDAGDARWFSRAEMAEVPLTTRLVEYLDEYGAF